MPLLTEQYYNIDFYVIDGNDEKSIIILDNSTYLNPADKPTLQVILPGFTGYVTIPYTPNNYTVLNSDSLDLTSSCEYSELSELPDGVYQIKMQSCPTEILYKKKCYLKTSCFYSKFQELLLNNDLTKDTYDSKKLKENILNLEILIETAKAYVQRCELENGIKSYTTATKLLDNITRKLNCK